MAAFRQKDSNRQRGKDFKNEKRVLCQHISKKTLKLVEGERSARTKDQVLRKKDTDIVGAQNTARIT